MLYTIKKTVRGGINSMVGGDDAIEKVRTRKTTSPPSWEAGSLEWLVL